MKESPKVIARPVKVNTGNAEIDKMLLGKQLFELMLRTRKLLVNMRQAYKVILRKSTTFNRSKLKSLNVWEAMSESSYLIDLMKGITGLIFQDNET